MVDRHNDAERSLTISFDLTGLIGLNSSCQSFLIDLRNLLVNLNLLGLHLALGDDSSLSLRLQLGDKIDQLLLNFFSLRAGLLHLVQTTIELGDVAVVFVTTLLEQSGERLNQNEIRGWRDVVVTTQLEEVALG